MPKIPPLAPSTPTAKEILLSPTSTIPEKMRALFHLRNIISSESVDIIKESIHKTESILLQHEMCYVLGQMGLDRSKNALVEVLKNRELDEITRHEAAESLANFNDYSVVEALKEHLNDESVPLRETCYIAVKKLEERKQQNHEKFNKKNSNQSVKNDIKSNELLTEEELSIYDSRDPAIPLFKEFTPQNIKIAEEILLNENECLYKKYKSMFFLRDYNTTESHSILVKAFNDSSALLKHELAFIMGQIRFEPATEALNNLINSPYEHGMVKHEAAEALGAIGTDLCKKYLLEHKESSCDILRESVEVALDIWEYENNEEAEYALVN